MVRGHHWYKFTDMVEDVAIKLVKASQSKPKLANKKEGNIEKVKKN